MPFVGATTAADARKLERGKKIDLRKLKFQKNKVCLPQVDLHTLLAVCVMSPTTYLLVVVD